MGEQFQQRYPSGAGTPIKQTASLLGQGSHPGQPGLSNGQTHRPHDSPHQIPQQQQAQPFPGSRPIYPAQQRPPPAQNYPRYGPGVVSPSLNQVPPAAPASQQYGPPPPTVSHQQPLPPQAYGPRPSPQNGPPPPVANQIHPPINGPPPLVNQMPPPVNGPGSRPPMNGPPLPGPITRPPNSYPTPMNGAGSAMAPPPGPPGRLPPSATRPAAPGQQYGGMYPQSAQRMPPQAGLVPGMEQLSVAQQGFNKLWGVEHTDLMQCGNVLPASKVAPPPIKLPHEFMNGTNCSPEIFCCTMNKIPETNSLLQKSRLPLGVLIHPFRDLTELPVIQCSSIVRCRACRTYINPFVYFVDNKRWKCNLCFRPNDLPDEFQYDPVTKTYGDPTRRPEIKSCTIEFIAPSEYMLRPPQPAIYLFLLDISRWGCDSGYLAALTGTLLEELDQLPGDARTQVGFILFDSCLHFFSIPDGASQARELIVSDIEDVFLPTPDSLLVNLQENKSAIRELLEEFPRRYAESFDIGCALGPALQAAHKLMSPTGGRVSLFQASLPNRGAGSLAPRDSTEKDTSSLGPQTDFYKRLALECSTQQIAVDLFLVSSQYADLSTVGGISQFSGGCVNHFPQFRSENVEACEKFTKALRRYLTRKIGFEAVMRVRCSRGLAIHTFHGNFFVRSTDLLSLPNVNPDAGFGMQVTIEESLSDLHSVCFQAALLYTSAKGERRIRVHTLCLPTSTTLSDILHSANQQAIIGLLAKMAVDRSLQSNLSDAREAFINASIDILSAYKLIGGHGGGLMAPSNLTLIPLYILALLKSVAFRSGSNIRLDDRMFAMLQMKNLPLRELIQSIHPDLYDITTTEEETGADGLVEVAPKPRLGLSLQYVDSRGAYLLDTPYVMYILLGELVSQEFLQDCLGVPDTRSLGPDIVELPEIDTHANEKLRAFVNTLQLEKPYSSVIRILTQPRQWAPFFVNDKSENALSYHELLNHIKTQVK